MSLQSDIDAIAAGFNGRLGIAAYHLKTEETFTFHARDLFPTASVIKLPVLITLFAEAEAGAFSLDESLMLRRADQIGGSGLLKNLSPGLTMSVRDWAFLMMNISDNTATNVLIDLVGLDKVQAWLADQPNVEVYLHNKIDFPALADDLHHFGTATPAGLTKLTTAVFQRKLVSPAACDEMMRMMAGVGMERVGRYLPFAPFDADVPPDEKLHLAGKTGSFKGTRAQTAVVWRGDWDAYHGFAITVMTTGDPAPETWHTDAAGVLAIGRVAEAIFKHWMMV